MAEPTQKQLALQAVQQLPEDATLQDIMERLYLLEKIERGRADVREGRVVAHEEVLKRFGRSWSSNPRIDWSDQVLSRPGASRISRRIIIALILLLVPLAPSLARAQSADAASKRIDILFIGNSYTYYNDLPAMLRTLAGAGRDSIIVHVASVTEGGASLRTHWNNATIARIRERAWDYVVLQDQSLTPIERRPQFIDYGRRFAAEIRSAGAKVVLYLTWAREQRPADQDLLDSAYLELARETGALIVPVGPAWRELRDVRGLPSLYDDDGSHPSPLGSFVAATVFHRVLFGALPPDASGAGFGIQPQTITLVHRAVEAVMARFPRE